jgi:hypothetical protein
VLVIVGVAVFVGVAVGVGVITQLLEVTDHCACGCVPVWSTPW